MAGVGYSYFNSDYVLSNYQINQKLLYGFGIGVGIILLFGVFIFLSATDFIANYFLTFPVFILMVILFIVYSRPKYYEKYIAHYDKQWDENSTKMINFQWSHSCCGYYQFNDRGIPNCPFEFTSCCSDLISEYFKTRFNEMFISSLTILCMFVVSVIVLLIYYCIEDPSSIIEDVYLFGDLL